MSGVSIRGLVKRFGSATAVADLDLDIAAGEFVTLLGPSGCGKTTTLRCLAGLEVPTSGEVSIGKNIVYSGERSVFVPPDKRGIGMVFQSYALWPHMSVRGNVGYPLKLAKVAKPERNERVADMLERVHLADRVDDAAVALSGGQQQRVALARAMVNRPQVLLFDEPLSNLDVKLRQSMRAQIRELHDEMGTTSVYVTHDQEEAIALADRVVVMDAGRILQVGTPQHLYTRPESAFVADFMGFQNILPATVVSADSDDMLIEVDGTDARLRVADGGRRAPGSTLLVAFRASHVEVAPRTGDAAGSDALVARIERVTYLGSSTRVLVGVKGVRIRTQLDENDRGRFGPDDLVAGREVTVRISHDHIVALPRDGASAGPNAGDEPADTVPAPATFLKESP
jgi:iron(III) transport system ATP-binding protein